MQLAQSTSFRSGQITSRMALIGIFGVYFLNSAVLGNWIPRIPDIKANLGISDSVLGTCILAFPIGTLLSFLLASSIVQKVGLKKSCGLFQATWALCFMVPGFANSLPILIFGLFLAGFSVGFIEVAINSKAADMENQLSKPIMSRCHGFWSIGAMVGALIGSLFAEFEVSTALHFLIIMPVIALLALSFAWILPHDLPQKQFLQKKGFNLPTKAVLILAILPLGIMATEGIYIDWSAIYLRDNFAATPFVAGSVYMVFSAMMSVSRLSGDYLSQAFGPVRLVFWSGLCGSIGLLGVALAPNLFWVYCASMLCGLGLGNIYPQVMSAAAKCAGNPTNNVAAVSLIEFTMFLFTPALIGYLSDNFGMRIAFLCYVPLAALSFILAKEIKRQPEKSHQLP